jgi:hypothetical protein
VEVRKTPASAEATGNGWFFTTFRKLPVLDKRKKSSAGTVE